MANQGFEGGASGKSPTQFNALAHTRQGKEVVEGVLSANAEGNRPEGVTHPKSRRTLQHPRGQDNRLEPQEQNENLEVKQGFESK